MGVGQACIYTNTCMRPLRCRSCFYCSSGDGGGGGDSGCSCVQFTRAGV